MSNIIQMPTQVEPPEGFEIEYFCDCGLGCSPEYLEENPSQNCEIRAAQYSGPGVHLRDNTGFQLNSYWSAEQGIFFEIHSHGYESDADDAEYGPQPITVKELACLPEMVKRVLNKIKDIEEVPNHV